MTSSIFNTCNPPSFPPSSATIVSDLVIFIYPPPSPADEEHVSCLSRPAGFTKESGGRVALPTSGSVEADSPHLRHTAAPFWHASKS